MALQTALEFLEEIARRPALQEDLRQITDYEGLARVARKHGFSCTGEELNRVFRYECLLRQARERR